MQVQKTQFSQLIPEILGCVASFVDETTLIRMQEVCRQWNNTLNLSSS
jgi:hypothetical protein